MKVHKFYRLVVLGSGLLFQVACGSSTPNGTTGGSTAGSTAGTSGGTTGHATTTSTSGCGTWIGC
jgi:hypothetical protein